MADVAAMMHIDMLGQPTSEGQTMKILFAAAAIALVVSPSLVPRPARAQSMDVERFRPSSHGKDMASVRTTEVIDHLDFCLAAMSSYSSNTLLLLEKGSDNAVREVIQHRWTSDLQFCLGLWEVIEFGLDVPVVGMNKGEAADLGMDMAGAGIGDVRIDLKGRLLRREGDGFGLALGGTLGLPTGDEQSLFGSSSVTFGTSLIADVVFKGFGGAINVGVLLREEEKVREIVLGHELTYGAGFWAPIIPDLARVELELQGFTPLTSPFQEKRLSPLEARTGFRFLVGDFQLLLGAGTGLVGGVGAPDYRVFGGVRWCRVERDRDGDGVEDDADRCPADAEDPDGFEDLDGCPDADNDRDGVPDQSDACPGVAEDTDDFEDSDGCPDNDNDGDGIVDAGDQCPNRAEVVNGFEDDDGCPDEKPVEKPPVEEPPRPVEFPSVNFTYDSADLDSDGRSSMTELARVLSDRPGIRVRIEGHASSEGTERYNIQLSNTRALTVARFLVDQGISESRVETVAYGESRPIADNSTEEGRQRNRRVELLLLEQ